MITAVLAAAAAALYLWAAWQIARRLLDHTNTAHSQAFWPAAAGAVAHAVLITVVATLDGQLTFQFLNAMSTTSWVVVSLVLLLALREPVASLGIAVLPIAALFALASALLPHEVGAPLEPGVALHAGVSVVAYGILMISAAQACVIALQNNRLHARAPGGFVRNLPPLASMERLLFRLIGAGFLALSIALGTGLLFLDNMFAQGLAHKTVLSGMAWAVFGTLLIGRKVAGWRGKTAVRWTLLGSGTLILAYAGSKFVSEILLGQ